MTTNPQELELLFGPHARTSGKTRKATDERVPHLVAILPRGEASRNFVYSGTLEEVGGEVEVSVLSVLPGGDSEEQFRACAENLSPLEEIAKRRAVNTLRELLDLA